MKKLRYGMLGLSMLLCMATSATAQVSIGIGLPNISIGINLPLFPDLVAVPGYPVYYAPRMEANYFFYDGMYWVYQDDNWYSSSWYNGPWWYVEPETVPLFILRIPVRYYRQPPVYFRGWQINAAPRWDQHWGPSWQQRRSGWDRWNRNYAPARAPLPVYQRQYSGDRYPSRIEQQHTLRNQSYRYQPRDKAVRQHLSRQVEQKAAPVQRGRQNSPSVSPQRPRIQQTTPVQQRVPAPVMQSPDRGRENIQRARPTQTAPQQRAPEIQNQRQRPVNVQREQKAPKSYDRAEQKAPRSYDRPEQKGREEYQERGRSHGQGQKEERERGR